MKRLLVAGAAWTVVLGGSAMAADLAVRIPPSADERPRVHFSWTGCYIGGNGGAVWLMRDYTFAGPKFADSPDVGASLDSHTVQSGIGGVQAGCNYQIGGWVFGIQGDYDWMHATVTHVDTFFLATDSWTSKSLASVTGRVGYAWDRFLQYVKVGGAWDRDEHSTFFPDFLQANVTRLGWTVGGGFEYAFTNWLTGFFEYDYYRFPTSTNNYICAVPDCFDPGISAASIDIKETKQVVKAGFNLKFGPSVAF